MENWKKDRIASCENGKNPTLMIKMKSGFAVIADNQFLPGYCILLRYPKVEFFSDLTLKERAQYLVDTTLIGDAINSVCAPRRINYSTLMNQDNFLHTHIEARYEWEDEENKYKPSWRYPIDMRYSKKHEFNEKQHGDMKRKITEKLIELMKHEGY